MYWATLFVLPADASSPSTQGNVYCMGVTDDGGTGKPTQISISRSSDYGRTWARAVSLTASNMSYSTGPTPMLIWPPGPPGSTPGQRIYRAYEHNTSPGWAVGYSSVIISAPLDGKSDLLSPSAWSLSGELPFSKVAGLVPANWTRPAVVPGYGWLEGGVVEPSDPTDPGVYVILRVNSQPTANKGALLYLPTPSVPGAPLLFKQWIEPFPGGMTKFDVRRDPLPLSQGGTGLYVTLSNNIVDDSVSLAPTCSYMSPVVPANKALPCCGFLEACDVSGGTPTCLWCHAGARNNLTLSVSPSPGGPWRVLAPVLWDDTGVPAYISTLGTGFQYVSWQFDEPAGDLIAAVRAGYRGSNNYHNANRLLFKRVPGWRALAASA